MDECSSFFRKTFSSTESLDECTHVLFLYQLHFPPSSGTFYQQLQFLSVDFISPKILQANEAGTIHIGKERNMQWELNLISADDTAVEITG